MDLFVGKIHTPEVQGREWGCGEYKEVGSGLFLWKAWGSFHTKQRNRWIVCLLAVTGWVQSVVGSELWQMEIYIYKHGKEKGKRKSCLVITGKVWTRTNVGSGLFNSLQCFAEWILYNIRNHSWFVPLKSAAKAWCILYNTGLALKFTCVIIRLLILMLSFCL